MSTTKNAPCATAAGNLNVHSTADLYGNKLAALDGDIGHVKDFYFDDETWVIRYLVADTGSWLTGRQVLLSPHAFGELDQHAKTLHVRLQKHQIENSPSIDSHRPVSRQFEVEYYGYYGWPAYWQGDSLWGLGGYPAALPPTKEEVEVRRQYRHRDDKHLRSAMAVTGYHIRTNDGTMGKWMTEAGLYATWLLKPATGTRENASGSRQPRSSRSATRRLKSRWTSARLTCRGP